MTQRTARQWIINGVLIVITLSFLGVSIAPLIGGLFAPPNQQAANSNQNTSEQERIKIQIEGFEAVLKSDPKNQTALIGLVNLRNQLGKVKETIEPLQTLSDTFPDTPEYRMTLAKTYLELKDTKNAVAEYRKILTTKPGYIPALQSVVGLELNDKRPEAAIGLLLDTLKTAETANKIQANSVDTASVRWILGEVYRQQNRLDDSIATYDQMIKENPKDFRPYVGKAQLKQVQGKDDEAKKLFDKGLELAPADFKDEVKRLAALSPQKQPNSNSTQSPSSTSDTPTKKP
ncbi:MAG: tetratricopeptide repeat protein [Pseudanabaena sp. M158S2SP1A06QC]|uniref:tetratricopeptide repeat protein n=1 Tax=Pseudanabaena mucicola TaxID=71190 RepID=UPI002578C096|nr:tetratricopeptide repeat protein [Pseudanabaena mucicola]MCA6575626.1 tetratricopeptide repeat protein [Pseudanabaena sp. M53BS1SP1A06MG]MCA6583657.1 tetratricopeptide repeat protein [Pseudanabaena sp. M34BS1SP1A06MG]MCA6590744.1 tetratricopeptide repeat protein [Pseudanabaena sp. M38BS1SP1A06MG]MCA6598578.1 tetratricopeptide repeat protein [Pseudanabaena sp. M046S1SP1A06QC]MCA6602681.1 tetratricopeptide repeat protein [Pseudanabaena sp. M57BS1SP1A06MG]MCA6612070.1 tetratricopeptide repeat